MPRVESVPPLTGIPILSIFRTGGVCSAAPLCFRKSSAWYAIRSCTATPPPTALGRMDMTRGVSSAHCRQWLTQAISVEVAGQTKPTPLSTHVAACRNPATRNTGAKTIKGMRRTATIGMTTRPPRFKAAYVAIQIALNKPRIAEETFQLQSVDVTLDSWERDAVRDGLVVR